MRKIGLFCLLVFWAGFVSVACAEDYVAMVMDVDTPSVQFSDGEPVEIMAFLGENDVVQIKDGAKVVIIFFESSIREEITGPAVITIGVNGSVSSAGRSSKIRKQSVDYLPPKAQLDKSHYQNFGNIAFRKLGKSTSDETQLVITSISNTAYVPDARPMLTWKVYPLADKFVLRVRGPRGEEVFTTKSSAISLAERVQGPGRYTWVLEAKQRGKVVASRDGWYSIMTDDEYQVMKASRQMIQDEYPAGSMQEMAVLSMLYQGHGLWNEMSLMLMALHKKQPDNVEVVRKIRSINPHLLEQMGN